MNVSVKYFITSKLFTFNKTKLIMKNIESNTLFILILILPLSIIFGSLISLINILFLGFLYLYFFFRFEHFNFLLNNKTIKIFIILYFYLLFNNIISLNFEIGFYRNFGFFRLILLFLAINFLFYHYEKNKMILYFWTVIISVFVFDVYFERITGANIFGWGAISLNGIPQPHGIRVVSFFKDEPIAGAFMNGFIFLILGFILNVFKNEKFVKIIFLLFALVFIFSVLITGERSNSIKAVFGLLLFIYMIDVIDMKSKIILSLTIPIIIIITVLNSDYLKLRYFGQIFSKIYTEKNFKYFENSIYIKLYKSGFTVFKNYPLLGVGNKNYRIETCDKEKVKKYNYFCITHPHQIYLEFLSEHGLIGTIIILFLFFVLIFQFLKIIILSQNYLQIGAFCFLLCNFLPIIPSGAFFSDFNITLFVINLSIMYAVNRKTNVFFSKKES